MSKVYFITGCSTGFGRNLAMEALQQGNQVAVTSRNTDDVQDIVTQFPDRAVAIKLDVTNAQEVAAAVKQKSAPGLPYSDNAIRFLLTHQPQSHLRHTNH